MAELVAAVVYVKDVRAAVAFWERAFGACASYMDAAGDYAEIDVGHVKLAFDSERTADEEGPPGGYRPNRRTAAPAGFELAVQSADLEASLECALDAGAELLSRPTPKSWGQTIAYVRDPWGVLIAIGSPWHPADQLTKSR